MRSAPFDEVAPPPNRLRWDPLPFPDAPTDFIDGLVTMRRQRRCRAHAGLRHPHLPRDQRSMERRVFYDADGELLIVPQQGRLLLRTELGLVEAEPRRDRA